MNQIDWSKAPEDALAALVAKDSNRSCRGRVIFMSEAYVEGSTIRGTACEDAPFRYAMVDSWDLVERPIQQWNGEGLPPVGTVCEWRPKSGAWIEAKIAATSGAHLWVETEPKVFYTVLASYAQFRPIRTPEQIAAEERDNGLADILNIMRGENHSSTHEASVHILFAERIYDAGYRKVEGGDA
jgi:hypothetical protein